MQCLTTLNSNSEYPPGYVAFRLGRAILPSTVLRRYI